MDICEICGTKFSSDFTDESEAVLLIGLLTDLRGYLAVGQWLAPDMCSYCFLVTQISQMTQIFIRGRVWSHRFHRFTQIFYGISGESLCPIPGGICNDRTGRLREIPCHPMMKKICVNLRNLRDKKNVPRKICGYL